MLYMQLKLTTTQAAIEYNVPRSTLGDRVSHKVEAGAKSGPSKYLNDIEDIEECELVLRYAKIGYTRKQVMGIVQRVLDVNGVMRVVSDGWWTSFSRRHPRLTLRNPSSLSRARAAASNIDTLNDYFDLFEETIDMYDLRDRPELYFNMDESGMPLNAKSPKLTVRPDLLHQFHPETKHK